jgi:hypothetical protein
VGTGEKVLVSCFIMAMTMRMMVPPQYYRIKDDSIVQKKTPGTGPGVSW